VSLPHPREHGAHARPPLDRRRNAMKQMAVTIDDFLTLEEQGRKVARLRAPAREVRRFHAAVRRFATAWCSKPTRRITAEEAKGSVGLVLELQDRYGWIEVMSLRAV